MRSKFILAAALGLLLSSPMANAEEGTWDKAKSDAGDAWGNIKKGSGEMWEATKEGSGDAWDGTKETSKGLWDSVKGAFSSEEE
jgi:hypothetical protein